VISSPSDKAQASRRSRSFSIVVDGSNVAYEERTAEGKPRLENLYLAMEALHKQYDRVIVIIDAALHHQIDHPQELEDLLQREVVIQAPAETEADYFILETADQLGADVLSNDTFRQYHTHWPWIEDRRIPYMIVDDRFIIYRPAQAHSRMGHGQAQPAGG